MDEPVANFERLEALREVLGEGASEVLGRLIALYRRDAPQHLERARGAADAGDREAVRASVHALRSCSSNLGVAPVQELAGQIEKALRAGDPVDLQAELGSLGQRVPASIRALEAWAAAQAVELPEVEG